MTSAASIVSTWHTSCYTRFTRGRVRELKNAHNSVSVQNRTHVYMNFFDHKNLGNHLLQLRPKVVKHPVYHLSSKPTTPVITKRLRSRGNFHLTSRQQGLESNNNPWTHPRYYISSYVMPWLHSMSCLVRSKQRSRRDSNHRASENDGYTSERTFLYNYSNSFELQDVRMWRTPI